MIQHITAANPGHVSDFKYAFESWTPGGTSLGVAILVVLAVVYIALGRSRSRGRRRNSVPARQAWQRAPRVPASKR